MAKDPAFLFYSSDFLTGTMFMSNEQVGKYIRLLCAQHQTGHLKELDMINICGSRDEVIFNKFAKDAEGKYYNIRCEEEIVKRKKYSLSRSTNRKSITKKEEKPKNISKSYVNHMENENEDVNEDKKEIKTEPLKPKKPELIFPYTTPEFLNAWQNLLTCKKWKNKEHIALQSSLKKLSKYPVNDAIEMIENTITGGWQGLFELEKYKNGNKENTNTTGKSGNYNGNKAETLKLASLANDFLANVERQNNNGGG